MKRIYLTADHILYGISTANALRLAWAYAAADAGGNILSVPGAFGSLLGASISLGTAFIAGKLGGKLTKIRTTIVWTALILLLVLEPTILAPITMSHMPVAMVTLLGPVVAWIWSIVMALVPSLVLAGVSIANGGLIEAGAAKPLSENGATLIALSESQSFAESRSAKKSGRSKSQSEKSEPQVTVACRNAPQCDRTFTKATRLKAQNAENAHAGKCGFRPLQTVLPIEEQIYEKPA